MRFQHFIPAILIVASPGVLANCFSQNSSQKSLSAQTLKPYSVSHINTDSNPSFVEEELEPDFKPDVSVLNQGDAQFYGKLLSSRELQSPENKKLYEMVKKINLQGTLDMPGEDVSYLKLVYIIPKATPNAFSRELLSSENYVKSTMAGTAYIDPTQENLENLNPEKVGEWLSISNKLLVTRKNLMAGLSAKTVFEVSHCSQGECDLPASVCKGVAGTFGLLGAPEKITHSKLLYSNYSTLSDSSSITYYYAIDGGRGTLVVSYTLAKLNFGWFAGAQRGIAKNANRKEFPEETGHMILQNRKIFAKK